MDLSHEEKLIAMKGFQAGIEKDASAKAVASGIVRKGKSIYKALVDGVKGNALKATKGSQSGVATNISKNRGKAHSVGKHLRENKALYGTGAAAGSTGYLLGRVSD